MKNRLPFIITVSSMMLGVFIAILFGINEGYFKDKITSAIKQNPTYLALETPEDQSKYYKKEKDKNWRYYQRFHFHSTGISTMTLGLLILLSFSLAPKKITLTSKYLLSVGGFLYPFIWLLAAEYGPIIGRNAAKEKFCFFGYMGGLFLIGIILSLYCLTKYSLKFESRA